MDKTKEPPTPKGDTDNPELLHVPECKAIRSLQVITSPLCGKSGETAKKLEDATCPACIKILTGVQPRPADIRNYEKPNGMDIRLADDGDTAHEALRSRVSQRTKAFLWTPDDAITFTPPLASVVYGDGQRVFAFTTTNDRPAYWVVRGDSSWRTWYEQDGTDITEFTDTVTENLRREFGDAEPGTDDEKAIDADNEEPYPAIDLRGGYSWRRLSQVEDAIAEQPKHQPAGNAH